MNNKIIGFFAILCSPFLAIDLILNGSFNEYNPTSLDGLFSFIYMTGWLLCIWFLFQIHTAANKKVKTAFIIQIVFLCLAEIWNIWSVIEPKSDHFIFRTLDLFWPVSNCFMFVTGLAIVLAKRINGWQRYAPLVVGLWFPTGVLAIIAFAKTSTASYFICAYSTIAWSLLGLSVYTNNQHTNKNTLLSLTQPA